MKIIDAQINQNTVYGQTQFGAGYGDTGSQCGWSLYLMPNDEPQSLEAIEQEFDQTDLSYLYGRCVGVAHSVLENPVQPDRTQIVQKAIVRYMPKGLSYRSATSSFSMPDRISGLGTNRDVSAIVGDDNPTRMLGQNYRANDVTAHWDNPTNLTGIVPSLTDHNYPPKVYINGSGVPTPMTVVDGVNQFANAPIAVTSLRLVFPTDNSLNGHCSWRFVSPDIATGRYTLPKWCVFATNNTLVTHGRDCGPDIPYISDSVSADGEGDAPYVLLEDRRNAAAYVMCDNFILTNRSS